MNSMSSLSRAVAIAVVMLGGCSTAEFTEADLGRTREVHAGSVFRISLPAVGEWAAPRLKGVIVHFLNRHREGSGGRNVFEFKAELEGEIEILIPARPGWGADRDFGMRVRVVDSSAFTDSGRQEDWRDRDSHGERD